MVPGDKIQCLRYLVPEDKIRREGGRGILPRGKVSPGTRDRGVKINRYTGILGRGIVISMLYRQITSKVLLLFAVRRFQKAWFAGVGEGGLKCQFQIIFAELNFFQYS